MIKVILYKGVKYVASKTNPKYFYYAHRVKGRRIRVGLHRQVYIDNYGDIPEGHEIHHKDEDTLNNEPENLQAVLINLHRSFHQSKRMSDPERRAVAIKALTENRSKATAWHKSKEGLEWHSKNAKESWEKRKSVVCNCVYCGNDFQTKFSDTMFCSNKCWQRARRAKHKSAAA